MKNNLLLSPIQTLFQRANEAYIPLFVSLEITLKCNLKCAHCYNFDRSEPKSQVKHSSRFKKELEPDEVYRILDELAAEGTLMIAFTGGEAITHPHLSEFVQYARKLHFGIRLKSNATLLSPAKARELAKSGVTEIDISLYGSNPKSHDQLTTVPGSFHRTLRGIRAALDAHIRPRLSIIVHRANYQEVDEMIHLAREWGISYGISTDLSARYDGSKTSQIHRLNREELKKFYMNSAQDQLQASYHAQGDIRCSCARSVCGINAVGDVYPCIGSPIYSGNIREKSFHEIWKNSVQLNRIRQLELQDFKSCEPCSLRKYCQRSSGSTYVNTGHYTGADPWSCMEASVIQELSSKKTT